MTEQLHPSDEQLRKADEADVVEWKQDGQPIPPEDVESAVNKLAEHREKIRQEYNQQHEGEQDD